MLPCVAMFIDTAQGFEPPCQVLARCTSEPVRLCGGCGACGPQRRVQELRRDAVGPRVAPRHETLAPGNVTAVSACACVVKRCLLVCWLLRSRTKSKQQRGETDRANSANKQAYRQHTHNTEETTQKNVEQQYRVIAIATCGLASLKKSVRGGKSDRPPHSQATAEFAHRTDSYYAAKRESKTPKTQTK